MLLEIVVQYVEVEMRWERIGFAVMAVRLGCILPVILVLSWAASRIMQLEKAGLTIALAAQKLLNVKKLHDVLVRGASQGIL